MKKNIKSVICGFAALATLSTSGFGAMVAQWTFEGGSLADSTGNWNNLTLGSGATLSDGRLVLNGVDVDGVAEAKGWIGGTSGFETKTLVSWVSLTSLGTGQSGGGALSLMENQSSGNYGGDFDAIAYGEVVTDQWMNGSDYLNRTEGSPATGNGGTLETTTGSLIQMAIVYDSGTITIYRDGDLYASNSATLATFDLGADSAVAFGARNISVVNGASGSLHSEIEEARIYDTALTQSEIQSLVVAVPEPSSAALLGLGGLALMLRRRK